MQRGAWRASSSSTTSTGSSRRSWSSRRGSPTGRIKYAVEVVDGLEHAPDALNRLFTGDHTGKLIVRVSEPSAVGLIDRSRATLGGRVAGSGTPSRRMRAQTMSAPIGPVTITTTT